MSGTGLGLRHSRLRLLAGGTRAAETIAGADEHCELCGEVIGADHRHVFDGRAGELRCTCGACAVLFDRVEAGGGIGQRVQPGQQPLHPFHTVADRRPLRVGGVHCCIP